MLDISQRTKPRTDTFHSIFCADRLQICFRSNWVFVRSSDHRDLQQVLNRSPGRKHVAFTAVFQDRTGPSLLARLLCVCPQINLCVFLPARNTPGFDRCNLFRFHGRPTPRVYCSQSGIGWINFFVTLAVRSVTSNTFLLFLVSPRMTKSTR